MTQKVQTQCQTQWFTHKHATHRQSAAGSHGLATDTGKWIGNLSRSVVPGCNHPVSVQGLGRKVGLQDLASSPARLGVFGKAAGGVDAAQLDARGSPGHWVLQSWVLPGFWKVLSGLWGCGFLPAHVAAWSHWAAIRHGGQLLVLPQEEEVLGPRWAPPVVVPSVNQVSSPPLPALHRPWQGHLLWPAKFRWIFVYCLLL